MRALAIATAALLVLLAPLAAACEPTTSHPEVDNGQGFYVDFDCATPLPELCVVCGWPTVLVGMVAGVCTMWIYEESNGIEGLQRSDDAHDDTCGGQIEADSIIF